MENWQDEYMTLITDCEARESRLTDWEVNFIDSLRHWIEAGNRPNANQVEKLDEIWEKATARG